MIENQPKNINRNISCLFRVLAKSKANDPFFHAQISHTHTANAAPFRAVCMLKISESGLRINVNVHLASEEPSSDVIRF